MEKRYMETIGLYNKWKAVKAKEKLEEEQKVKEKWQVKHNGKRKVSEPAVSTVGEGKKRKCPTKSVSVMAESGEEGVPGPSKKAKMEIIGPMENKEELQGNTRAGHVPIAKTKKAAYSFNKDMSLSIAVGSKEISEAIQKLMDTVDTLANKVDQLTSKVVFLWSYIGGFIDDFNMKDIESPEDLLLVSNVEEWNALHLELEVG
ncbi:hypothetical protein ARMSODRAFT_973371 [Armillaria solidipes]|uniref:Uncharacterized protein n=1 Tax=Armillaria solidipes TaxID=1076256 RepID=A0A2H3BQ80_9AGAR|nr:hypothetical protein ARMSODRAFT_973371 [Armillaria solidipes]